MRPHEICQRNGWSSPRMFVRDADRFDINQGEIGDCWFLGNMKVLVWKTQCDNFANFPPFSNFP